MAATRHLLGIHAVREALRVGSPLRWVAVSRDRDDARVGELLRLARAAGVAVRFESAAALDRIGGGGRHQGVVAEAEAKTVLDLDQLLAAISGQSGGLAPTGLLLALDGIEDPQNLGAIIRVAAGAGVDGMVLPARRAAGLSDTVTRVSAGGLEHVRVARVGNLVQALERLGEAGYWSAGLAAEAPTAYWDHDWRTPTVIVVGAEGRGLHALTRKRCDYLLSIPLAPGVESLNAATATAAVLFEARRQRFRDRLPSSSHRNPT